MSAAGSLYLLEVILDQGLGVNLDEVSVVFLVQGLRSRVWGDEW